MLKKRTITSIILLVQTPRPRGTSAEICKGPRGVNAPTVAIRHKSVPVSPMIDIAKRLNVNV